MKSADIVNTRRCKGLVNACACVGVQAEVHALKRLQAETAAGLDTLLPALRDRIFKGEL